MRTVRRRNGVAGELVIGVIGLERVFKYFTEDRRTGIEHFSLVQRVLGVLNESGFFLFFIQFFFISL